MSKLPKTKERAKRGKVPAGKDLFLDDRPGPPSPAFRAFVLEDEWYGRRRLRGIGKSMSNAKLAPNSLGEIDSLYSDALGEWPVKWSICHNRAGEVVHQEEYVSATPEEAAHDLLIIARNATMFLSLLLEKQPELCRRIAATQSDWPVLADLTEKDWQRVTAETVARLELGKDIQGYLRSARTADENVNRCWATAIYETLFQTRFDYKQAVEKPRKYTTTEGCPEWARKTLDLPRFTRANASHWAKLGQEMLLQQKPDFLESPDLAGKKRSWTQRAENKSRLGKASLRAIQGQAFEDFAKEMKNLAPERNLWRGEW